MSYDGVMRLAKERPDWLPIAKACYETAMEYGEFAGSWALEEARKQGIYWFPNLKPLVTYSILKHTDTTRGGRRAYYIMPEQSGVGRALHQLGII